MYEMEGPLYKWTNLMKGYQLRYFVLDVNIGLFSYYTSREKLARCERRGCIRLMGATVGIADENDPTFSINSDGKIFHLRTNTIDERNNWVQKLEDAIEKAHTNLSTIQTQNNQNQYSRLRPLIKRNNATIESFNHHLSEADTYLQQLIDQCRCLDESIRACEDEDKKNKLIVVKNNSQNLLDSFKHTIVLIQLAKNVKYPINGTSISSNIQNSSSSIASSIEVCENAGGQSISSVSSNVSEVILMKPTNVIVPPVSYASSDDEDFFDANEESFDCDNSNMNLKDNSKNNHSGSTIVSPSSSSSTFPSLSNDKIMDDGIDYDKLYEDNDDEDELESMTTHGSVISHLISQVKIGMDLTKVALPTFILERRSLLEMYADFFAHADLFSAIPNYSTPQERIVQTVKWYLSAFHAGRKGSVAKKPYNPVLGEVFKCHWNLSKDDKDPPINHGPVPWAKKGDLTFVAEQVSHHPPISAFYAESVDKRIMCSAHIWTKSKFLGLSVGVNNLGSGTIYLLDHGEEYTCTFPSAYGRSILTEPWFEMGGPVEITCQQTGYHAKIDFLTKPFYGGKKHRISADIYGPAPTKTVIANITGEWNGQMFVKWAKTGSTELFFDTKTVPIIKKQVRSVREQEEYESRNYWKAVTFALKNQDVHEASNAKHNIEQKQRELAKIREEKNQKWTNRVFYPVADKWMFNDALNIRIKTINS